jgi:cytochrome P450 family 4
VWKIHRKSLNYSFNLKILQSFIPIFIENSQALVNDLSVNVGKKKEFDMLHYTTKAALNMICGNLDVNKVFNSLDLAMIWELI